MSKNRISDEAVHKATGRVWSEWEEWLDEHSAATLSHKEIVALLRERGGVESAWWQQSIAVGYERARGLREFGQRRDAGFEIGVQRTVALQTDEAWRRLTDPDGVRAWLGDAPSLRLEVGEAYRLADGTAGEVRTFVDGERLRVTWRPNGWARASTIQIRVTPKGEKSVIAFHEENLPNAEARESRRAHYQEAIAEIVKG